MGVCLSAEEKEQKEISQTIDRGLEEDNRRLKKECKILLLGKTKRLCQNEEARYAKCWIKKHSSLKHKTNVSEF